MDRNPRKFNPHKRYCTVLLLYYNSKQNIPYNWPTEQILTRILSRLLISYALFITVLNNILLLTTRSRLSIAQASSSFKLFDTRMFTYAIPTFITEALSLVTQVQLFLTTVTVNQRLI